jgi:hypothetical protein
MKKVYIGVIIQYDSFKLFIEVFERKKDAEKSIKGFQKDVRSFRHVFERRVHEKGGIK